MGESCSLCGEPSSSSILLLPSAPPPSTYSTKKRGWVAKEWPYQIRERERGKEEEEEDELCFFSSSKNEKKKTNTPHPRHHARHPQLAFSLEHSIRINFPFFFLLIKGRHFIYLFFFPVAFSSLHLMIFRRSDPRLQLNTTAPADQPTTDKVILCAVHYSQLDGRNRIKGKEMFPPHLALFSCCAHNNWAR